MNSELFKDCIQVLEKIGVPSYENHSEKEEGDVMKKNSSQHMVGWEFYCEIFFCAIFRIG